MKRPGFIGRPGARRPDAARTALALLLLAALPLIGSDLGGGPFRLAGMTAAGGGASTGVGYSLIGSVPPAGSSVSAGGGYVLGGGLLPVQIVQNPAVPIKTVFTKDKLVELSWPEGAAGYVLEFSPAVGPDANWQRTVPQPVGNTFLTPCQQPARFFRLRKP